MNIPEIVVFEYELIINEKLYNIGTITEKQHNEVKKIINKKILYYSKL